MVNMFIPAHITGFAREQFIWDSGCVDSFKKWQNLPWVSFTGSIF